MTDRTRTAEQVPARDTENDTAGPGADVAARLGADVAAGLGADDAAGHRADDAVAPYGDDAAAPEVDDMSAPELGDTAAPEADDDVWSEADDDRTWEALRWLRVKRREHRRQKSRDLAVAVYGVLLIVVGYGSGYAFHFVRQAHLGADYSGAGEAVRQALPAVFTLVTAAAALLAARDALWRGPVVVPARPSAGCWPNRSAGRPCCGRGCGSPPGSPCSPPCS
ncbi:hypothetical protein [Streptomyces sp. XD-27]|uniref:hypothetical protein n=1 Tax=Streptomyces sp. XD-27 TaxID=3062779 RepID=UPI0026F42423|nr:hypothetical protein [Streptomyces sp. XD-27]WKX68944.1 hypothetical protein Q3Y56_02545 [Streptomyces sp. XD-27]